ncbi:MAG: type II toxin-antitoxin system prevent-host-death family antitoxin [Thermodesulfovibrionales bacterium]
MKTVNVHEAKTHLSRLLGEVESGREIVIAKSGKPMARLVPVAKQPKRRRPGTAKGKITISDSFYKPLPEDMLEAFEK